VGSNFTGLTVTWYDESDGYSTNANITSDVISIPLFTDTGSGEVNEAEIVISGKGGSRISTGNIFDKFDRIRIQITDLSSNAYDRYFEITDIIPSQSKTEGTLVTLRCLGIEYHTQMIHHARRDWFKNARKVAETIGKVYNFNNGSRQPTLSRHTDTSYSTSNKYGNGLPRFTNNHYEFGASEENCYNRWMDIVDLLGGAVGSGGVGDFFELGFDTSGVNAIDMALFVSGARTFDGNNPSNDSSAVVVENTTSINVSEQEGGISNPTGTKVAGWGSPTHGSLPVGTSKYRGEELEFIFRPVWVSGVNYKTNAKIIWTNGKHYKATSDHLSSGTNEPTDGSAPWSVIDMSSEFGDNIQYSEWTDDKAKLWANGGINPDAVSSTPAHSTGSVAYTIGDLVTDTGKSYVAIKKHTSTTNNEPTDGTGEWELVDQELKGNGAAFFDCNMTIRDDGTMFRTWVTEVIGDTDYSGTSDQTASTQYTHGPNDHWPIGHRVLNVSNTELSGNDIRGRAFVDAVAIRSITRDAGNDFSHWTVLYEQPPADEKFQVYDIKDDKIWEWNNGTSKWEDKTSTSESFGTSKNADCSHQWKSLYNIAGSDPRPPHHSMKTLMILLKM